MKQNILFLCTGNSCRSQMAEAWLRELKGDQYQAYSAGLEAHGINPNVVKVMSEAGIDVSHQQSTLLQDIQQQDFDYVITVCSHAHESCPIFPGNATVKHISFDDPPKMAEQFNDPQQKLECYRRVRNQIRDFIETIEQFLA